MSSVETRLPDAEPGSIKEAVSEHHGGPHHHKTPGQIYREHFHGRRRERMFLASFSFFAMCYKTG